MTLFILSAVPSSLKIFWVVAAYLCKLFVMSLRLGLVFSLCLHSAHLHRC